MYLQFFNYFINFFQIIGPPEPIIDRIPEDVIKPNETIPVQKLPNDKKVGKTVEVIVSDWYNPKDFYVQLRCYYSNLDNLMNDINVFYTDLAENKEKDELYEVEVLPGIINLYVAALYYNSKMKRFEGI